MKIFGRVYTLDNVDQSFYNRLIPLPEVFLELPKPTESENV